MDREDKFRLYEQHGVANYWIVDPTNRTIEAYVLANGRYALATKAANNETRSLHPFPDLPIPLSEVWPES